MLKPIMKLKHLIATLSLAGVMAIGVGAFVGTRSEAKAESVSATVTNGKYRINVLTNSANWLQDNVNTVFNPAGSNVAMSRDADFTQSSTNTSYSTVTIGNTTYNWQTYELSAKTGITKNENYWFGRGNASSNYNWFDSGINLYTQFRSNNWDNTIIISGSWDNWSASAYGWYVKVALHTGLNNGTESYLFMNSVGAPSESDRNVPSGYTFVGWYTDSNFQTPWTSGSQFTDVNLYAKYSAINYTVTKYKVLDGGSPTSIGSEQVAAGSTYSVPANRYEAGYTFGGWFTDSTCTSSYTARAINANTNLYAKYTSGTWSGTIHVDLRDSGWADQSANYAILFMDKTTYPEEHDEWSSYVKNVPAGQRLIDISYDIPFEPLNMTIGRFDTSASSPDWSKKWNQTPDIDVDSFVRIGNTVDGSGKNYAYEGAPKLRVFTTSSDIFLTNVKANGSGNAEYYSDSVTLVAGQQFKMQVAPYADGDYSGAFSTHSSISSNFSGNGTNNITVVTGGTYAFYFDSFTHSVYITTVAIADADEWSETFLSGVTCDATGASLPTGWDTLAGTYASLDGAVKNYIYGETANVSGTATQRALAKYDYAVAHHSELDRFIKNSSNVARLAGTSVQPVSPISATIVTNATAIVVIVTLVSLSVIGAYVYVRTRRKEN